MTHRRGEEATSARAIAPLSRRSFIRYGGVAAVAGLAPRPLRPILPGRHPAAAATLDGGAGAIDLRISETSLRIDDRRATATTINGTVPGPLLRFREGDEALIHVTNGLDEDTSIHWHGIILPNAMDGVPGVNFPGIRPGETFTYRFPIRQYGTYWYHSHSGLQEQLGHYGPLIIDPAEGEPHAYDREYVVLLSDWTFEDPHRVLARLKKRSSYYNVNRRTVLDLFRDVADEGLGATLENRLMWGRMRMSPTDISDVTGATYTYLMNGLSPAANWTGLFRPGERVRLRFINSGASAYFDVRIPGIPMTLIQASGQHVEPVVIDEFRIAVAETYDVIVQPPEERAYTIFAESMDRTGYARGTLAPREGMSAPIPPLRDAALLTMADMGMAHGDMAMPGHPAMTGGMAPGEPTSPGDAGGKHGGAAGDQGGMAGHHGGSESGAGMDHGRPPMPTDSAAHRAAPEGEARQAAGGAGAHMRPPGTLPDAAMHGPDDHGPGNAMTPGTTRSRLDEPGIGLGEDGRRVLLYTDLRAVHPNPDLRAPDREIELHLTGNMERFMWSIDGVKYSDAEPIEVRHGERIRLTLVNDTMMNHPMHLHGMWMELENGAGPSIPRVHTVNVKPAERLSLLFTADAHGPWAFHCHLLYHMEAGMFRVVRVSGPDREETPS